MPICYKGAKIINVNMIHGDNGIINQFHNQFPVTPPVYYTPRNSLIWLAPENMNLVFELQAETIQINQNSSVGVLNAVSPILTDKMVIKIGNQPTEFVIANIVGQNVQLTNNFTFPSGTYSIAVARLPQWQDSSAYNRNISNVLANSPFVGFDISKNSYFTITTTSQSLVNNDKIGIYLVNINVFAVYRAHIVAGGDLLYISIENLGGVEYFSTHNQSSVNSVYSLNINGEDARVAQNVIDVNGYNIGFWGIECDGIAPPQPIINNTVSVSVNGNTPSISSSASLLSIQNDLEAICANFDGELYEFIVMPVLSVQERQKLEGYLAWKYNLLYQLPNTHPYKNTRPIA